MKAKVIKLLSQNRKVKDIAAEVGCTRAYVYYIKAKEFPELTRAYKAKAKAKTKKSGKVVHGLAISRSTMQQLIEAEQAIRDQIPKLAAAMDSDKVKTLNPAFTLIDSGTLADKVNHPAHYTTGGIETYDYIVAKGLSYELGNVVKYVSRADHKGNKLEDLQKARWYLDAAIRTAGGAV